MRIPLRQVTTDDAVDVMPTSTMLLAANEHRKRVTIVNSSSADCWIRYGKPAEVGKGIFLASGGFSLEITWDNLWLGDIYAIHGSTGPQTLAVMELA